MRHYRSLYFALGFSAALLAPATAGLRAQEAKKEKAKKEDFHPSTAELTQLRERNAVLTAKLRAIEARVNADLFADAAVYGKAVDYLLRFPERFFRKEAYAEALAAVDEGLSRAEALEKNAPAWPGVRGGVAGRGFRSVVDGSLQPYCVSVPKNYDPQRPMRLDVILHGRNPTINEAVFLGNGRSGKIVGSETGRKGEPDCLKLYVFGRGNTSSMWSGEVDVYEAIASVRSRYNVDARRIVLRGFSMGGSSAWQLGLHSPSRWAAVEAGAGFVQTRPEVLKTIQEPWQLAALPIHDAANCALNMTNVPFAAYVGTLDEQRGQNVIIQENLAKDGYPWDRLPRARFFLGEGLGHTMKPEMKQMIDEYLVAAMAQPVANEFRFVAYTPRYGEFGGFRMDSLERLYERAELKGSPDRVQTKNVWVLKLDAPRTVTIDGQTLTGGEFHKEGGTWRAGVLGGLRKRAGLQGPIDDAFQDSFLCVPPASGKDATLELFRTEFACYLHGEVRVKAPAELTDADIAAHNLVLFGDPTTNPWIKKVLPRLPVKWTANEIVIAGRTFPAATHTIALIYPNPLNPNRYVVLNTGHTFSPKLFDDLHWYLYPRYGDYAVLDKATRAIQLAGFFDQNWQVSAK